MPVLGIIPTLTVRDLFDILLLSLVAYQLFVWFRGTKALRVLIGLVVLAVIYSLAKFWGLFMTTWAFQVLWQVLVILLLILFQSEIRQVLEKVSPLRYLRSRRFFSEAAAVQDVVQVAFDLAREETGAIIVLVREDNPSEFVHSGQPVMGLPGAALLKSIFNPHSPAHDGAVIITNGRLAEMGAILPLSERDDLPENLGTRHRAAIGLSERTDAVCLVVSEERGEVSTVVSGNITTWNGPEALISQLKDWLGLVPEPKPTLQAVLKGIFVENWGIKLGALALVALVWLVLAGQQDFHVSVKAPIKYVNLSSGLVLDTQSEREVNVEVSGRRRQAATLKEGDVQVLVNLGMLSSGQHLINLSAGNVDLPLGLRIERVSPPNVRVLLKPVAEVLTLPKEEGR
ncbi:MAG: diadenylate cyclase [Deltaproteobacteria bacterium]|nr:diadenylate cyclase [Deltaproteobacteria bacterium]